MDPKPLVIVDSLVSFHTGSENNASEVRAYMHGYRQLANLGATVILLHHSGKGDTSREYRGSSDIKASVDVAYHLSNLGDPSRLGTLRLKAFKTRFVTLTELILTYRDGRFEAGQQEARATIYDHLVLLLKANQGITASKFEALAQDKGLGRDRARNFLNDGIKTGRIRVEKGTHNTRSHTFVDDRNEAENDLF